LKIVSSRYASTFCSGNIGKRIIVFSDISFLATLAGNHPSESVKVRHTLSLAKI